MALDVYGVGNALVDIQAHVDDDLLISLNYPKGGMTLVDEAAQEQVLESVMNRMITRSAGGSAANTMVGISRLGGQTAYAGKVADDALGRFFLEDMQNLGIAVNSKLAEGGHSGTCVVLITGDAERTMLTHLGVSSDLGPEDIDEKSIRRSQYVYIEGYLFGVERNRQAALRAIELAKKHNTKVAFTVSDPFLIANHRDEFWELIRGPVDLLFCNLEEGRSLSGENDPVHCAHAIHEYAENVALTLGEEGSLLMHRGKAIPIEAPTVKAIDTTGAGDMYAAGIMYGITNGLSWKQAGHVASQSAAQVVSRLGARLPHDFTIEEVRALSD